MVTGIPAEISNAIDIGELLLENKLTRLAINAYVSIN